MSTDVVLPTKLPDGFLYAWRAGRDCPEPYIVEIATYPEKRAIEQALHNLMLVYLVRGEVPNVLVLVLRPKGRLRVEDRAIRAGSDGVTELSGRWRVVELWNEPADPVLAAADPGMMPLVPLMHAEEPPEEVIRRCREVIDANATAEEHDRLISAAQVFVRLRYKNLDYLELLGRARTMLDSVFELYRELMLRDFVAYTGQRHVLKALTARFGAVPPELEAEIREIRNEDVLTEVVGLAASSPDLEQFTAGMRAIPRPPEPWDPADEP